MLATKLRTPLRTPLQIQQHLSLSLEAGKKPVSAAVVTSGQSRQIDNLEPTVTRPGHRVKDRVEQFDVRPAETKALFNSTLDARRATQLRDKLLRAGLST